MPYKLATKIPKDFSDSYIDFMAIYIEGGIQAPHWKNNSKYEALDTKSSAFFVLPHLKKSPIREINKSWKSMFHKKSFH